MKTPLHLLSRAPVLRELGPASITKNDCGACLDLHTFALSSPSPRVVTERLRIPDESQSTNHRRFPLSTQSYILYLSISFARVSSKMSFMATKKLSRSIPFGTDQNRAAFDVASGAAKRAFCKWCASSQVRRYPKNIPNVANMSCSCAARELEASLPGLLSGLSRLWLWDHVLLSGKQKQPMAR